MKKNCFKACCLAFVFLFLFCGSFTKGQNSNNKVEDKEATTKKYEVSSVVLFDLKTSSHYVEIRLNSPQSKTVSIQQSDLDPNTNVTIKFLPSGRQVPANLINDKRTGDPRPDTRNLGGGNNFKILQIGLSDDPLASPDPNNPDDKVEITFKELHFEGLADPKKNVVATGGIYDLKNIGKLKEQTFKELNDAVANAKTTDEKKFFTDFNVTVPTKGGDTQGSGDVIFNKKLYNFTSLFDAVNFGFKLKKASEIKSDPRHFEVGLTFRKTVLRANRKTLNLIKSVANSPNPTVLEEKQALDGISALQKDFIRAFFFDSAIKFEADISNKGISNVSNLLYDGNFQIATVSQTFGRTGLFNFRLYPAGIEVGSNLTNGDNPDLAKHSLARFKTGGEMQLIFKSENPNDLIGRVTFSTQALDRYLFRKENIFDEATKKVVLVGKGNKYWLQSDLKVTTGITTGIGRVGFKVTYINGSLPPVYNVVKTFKFGLVFETNDDSNSENIKP